MTAFPWGMMSGLDQDTDAVVFIGYHGKAGTPRSVMAHTISGGVIADVRCNGRSLGELGLNTALAAHSGVPAVLVAGDDSVAAEAADVAPGMELADGRILRYAAPDFPTAYQVSELIALLGAL